MTLRFTLFRDIESAPRKVFLVSKLLGAGETSCIFGAPGSGKSVLATDLACHIAAGLPWFGRRVQQGGVLYVAAERAELTCRRLASFRKHYGLDDLPLAIVAGNADLRTNLKDVYLIAGFAKDLREVTTFPTVAIFVDTVSRVLNGGDENSPKDMGGFVANLTALQKATGAHILTIHHVPQNGEGRLRGHGALLGAIDTTLSVEKSANARTATVIKDNDGAEGEALAFNLESVTLSIDPETDQETTAPIVVPVAGAAKRTEARAKPLRMSDCLKLFRTVVMSIAADRGKRIRPFGADGPEVIAVDREVVRSEFYARWPADGETEAKRAEAKRKQFNRAEKDGVARQIIVTREFDGNTLLWLGGRADEPQPKAERVGTQRDNRDTL